MDVSDIPAPPNMPPTDAPTRCTVHVFGGPTVIGATPERVIVESGSPVRIADKGLAAGHAVRHSVRFRRPGDIGH